MDVLIVTGGGVGGRGLAGDGGRWDGRGEWGHPQLANKIEHEINTRMHASHMPVEASLLRYNLHTIHVLATAYGHARSSLAIANSCRPFGDHYRAESRRRYVHESGVCLLSVFVFVPVIERSPNLFSQKGGLGTYHPLERSIGQYRTIYVYRIALISIVLSRYTKHTFLCLGILQ